jgi:hypothetical protein
LTVGSSLNREARTQPAVPPIHEAVSTCPDLKVRRRWKEMKVNQYADRATIPDHLDRQNRHASYNNVIKRLVVDICGLDFWVRVPPPAERPDHFDY